MNNFTTLLKQNLLNSNDSLEHVVQELFRSELENAINSLLKDELTCVLAYEKYEHAKSGNYRNGYYSRELNTSYGVLHLNVPRDRNNEFDSPLVPKYERRDSSTQEIIMKLFNTGLTTSEITTIVESLYAKKYSKTTISNITDSYLVKVDEFKKRTLQNHYAVIYLDATFIPLRRDTVQKEALYIALGILPNGNKEILGYKIAPEESLEIWEELLVDLKDRGIKDVNLFCTDGLNGMPDAIHRLYSSSEVQICLLHVLRNINKKVRVCHRSEISNDFKKLFYVPNKDIGKQVLNDFINKWKTLYPKVTGSLEKKENLLTFLDFPTEIRQSIYNTNMIESLNKQIKRKTKRKEQFPNETSMEKFIVALFEAYNIQFLSRVHKGFNQIQEGYWN